eukprot:TRINITY_DN3849_c0_g1_i1.p1 TRINITY_DN3849_c0_g1~~TRINITY_DN3849_c0_g1_i1.p1  ORF type:complete len:972 (+),score=124.03 TRINITY_DN3849_c0_g1_i1:1885-4800(+)
MSQSDSEWSSWSDDMKALVERAKQNTNNNDDTSDKESSAWSESASEPAFEDNEAMNLSDVMGLLMSGNLDEIKETIPSKIGPQEDIYGSTPLNLLLDTIMSSPLYIEYNNGDKSSELIDILRYFMELKEFDMNKVEIEVVTRCMQIESRNVTLGCNLIKLLSENGLDLTKETSCGYPPIYAAVSQSRIPLVEVSDTILECCSSRGIQLNLSHTGGQQAPMLHCLFMMASPDRDADFIHFIDTWEQHCPGVCTALDAKQNTSLTTAAQFGLSTAVLQKLIDLGCDPNLKNTSGVTACASALSRYHALQVAPTPGVSIAAVSRAVAYLRPFTCPDLRGTGTFPIKALSAKRSWTSNPTVRGQFLRTGFFHATREPVSIKIAPVSCSTSKDFFAKASLSREIQNLDTCRSRFIVNFLTMCNDDNILYMVTEYCMVSLDVLLHNSRQSNIWLPDTLTVLDSVGSALLYLHENERVHGEVCATSVVVTSERRIKLSCFSSVTPVGDMLPGISALWTPPEVLTSVFSRIARTSFDVWSYGVFSFEVFSHCAVPYYDPSCLTTISQIKEFVLSGGRLSRPAKCDPDLWSVIEKCFSDCDVRPRIYDILEYLGEYRKSSRGGTTTESGTTHVEKVTSSEDTSEIGYYYDYSSPSGGSVSETALYSYPTLSNATSSRNEQSSTQANTKRGECSSFTEIGLYDYTTTATTDTVSESGLYDYSTLSQDKHTEEVSHPPSEIGRNDHSTTRISKEATSMAYSDGFYDYSSPTPESSSTAGNTVTVDRGNFIYDYSTSDPKSTSESTNTKSKANTAQGQFIYDYSTSDSTKANSTSNPKSESESIPGSKANVPQSKRPFVYDYGTSDSTKPKGELIYDYSTSDPKSTSESTNTKSKANTTQGQFIYDYSTSDSTKAEGELIYDYSVSDPKSEKAQIQESGLKKQEIGSTGAADMSCSLPLSAYHWLQSVGEHDDLSKSVKGMRI